MAAAAADNTAFYHPRNPRESPLFRLLEEHYEEFERVYPERYQQPDSVTGSWMRCGKDLRRMQLWNPQAYPSAVGRGIPQV